MREMLARLRAGELSIDEVLAEIRRTQLVELSGQARVDLGRPLRRGLPEVVLAAGKQPQDVARLVVALATEQGQGLASRLDREHWPALESAVEMAGLELERFGTDAALARRPGFVVETMGGRVAIVCAGTSDARVVEEARMLLTAVGAELRLVFDVGVAGLHRLMGPLAELVAWEPDVMIVAAGMDGVLPGVVAGLVDAPVIGVPVSTGYGAGGRGEGALLTMLQSCATGLTVVNIDNGIGAAAGATLIARRAAAARRPQQSAARRSRARRSVPQSRVRPSS